MMHIIFGLFFISLGIWGVFDEWFYVVSFLKGIIMLLLILGGLVGILASIFRGRKISEPTIEPEADNDSLTMVGDD